MRAEKPSTELELAARPAENHALEIANAEPADLIRFAIEQKSGIEIIERLTALYDKRRAQQAKAAYDAALAAFQAECPIIIKRTAGAKNMYKYAPLDHIVSQTRALLQKHGFSYSLTADIEPGWVKAACRITHVQGHAEVTEFKCPIDGNEKNAMSTPQRYGAAMTFAKRYAFCNGFGILTADDDTDAHGTQPKPQGPSTTAPDSASVKELAAEVWRLLAPKAQGDRTWQSRNQICWDENIISDTEAFPNLTTARYREVIEKIKAKLK